MFSVINRSTMKIIKQILKIDILLLISFSVLISQTKRDPRSVALAGTYTTIADGIFSIGYNPSLLAYQQEKPFMLQLGGFDFGIVGNYISLSNLYSLSGDTLSNNEKDLLYDNFKDNGLTFFPDFGAPENDLKFHWEEKLCHLDPRLSLYSLLATNFEIFPNRNQKSKETNQNIGNKANFRLRRAKSAKQP